MSRAETVRVRVSLTLTRKKKKKMEGDAERFADEAMAVTADDLPSPIGASSSLAPSPLLL